MLRKYGIFIVFPALYRKIYFIKTFYRFVAFDPAVEGVLEAFKRARRRLLEARGILNVD